MSVAVINHLQFREAPGPDLFVRAEDEVLPQAERWKDFAAFTSWRWQRDHFLSIILGDTPEVLDRVATEVGSPLYGTRERVEFCGYVGRVPQDPLP